MKKVSLGLVVAVAVAMMASESFARGGGGGGRGGFSGGGAARGGNFGGSGFSGGRSDFGGGNFNGGRQGGDFGARSNDVGNRAGENRPDANRNFNQNNFNGDRNFSNNNFNRAPGELDNRGFRDQLNQFNTQRDVNRDVNRNVDRSNFDHGYNAENRPFSAGWYADHPGAWRYTHPNAGVWAAATWAAATSWLGWGAVPASSYSTAYYDDGSSDDGTVSQTDSAEDIAAAGADDPAANAQWLPLGTYALSTTPDADPTHMLQLFVSKDGILRGSYYDVTSDGTQTIKGSVDPTTQRAAWSVGNGTVVFQTGLNELTQATAPLTVKFENGKVNTWTLTRLNNSNTAAAK